MVAPVVMALRSRVGGACFRLPLWPNSHRDRNTGRLHGLLTRCVLFLLTFILIGVRLPELGVCLIFRVAVPGCQRKFVTAGPVRLFYLWGVETGRPGRRWSRLRS